MTCPLCNNNKYITLKKYKIKELSNRWKKGYGFDPFINQKRIDYLYEVLCTECKLIYFIPQIFGDSTFYEKLSKSPWYYEENKWEFDQAVQYILQVKPSSVLEIGCGEGLFLEKIVNFVECVEGVEINQKALEICRSKGLSVHDCNLDNLNNTYDMIFLFEVLEHLNNFASFFDNLLSLLNTPGYLIIAVPNPESFLKEMGVVLLEMPPHHSSYWSMEVFDFVAAKYHLEKIDYKIEPLRYIHYLFFLSGLSSQIFDKSNNSLKFRILSKLALGLRLLFAPFYFNLVRDKILGQTHLIVLKKNKGLD